MARERPALVISDLRFPDGDGLDVVRAARSGANPLTGDRGHGLLVAKPFAAARLLAAVRSSLADSA